MSEAQNEENRRRRAMTVRAVIYVAAAHVWAGLLILMFTLGRR
jgi:hypothetical protein